MQNEAPTMTTSNRDIATILEEASDIGRRFKELPKHQPKDPHAVARLVSLLRESGMTVSAFVKKTKAVSYTTMLLWSKGKTTQAKPWAELQAIMAKQEGAARGGTSPGGRLGVPAGNENDKPRVIGITAKGHIEVEVVRVVRESYAPGTAEHTAILLDLFRRSLA